MSRKPSRHFTQRVHERIGKHVDARYLFRKIRRSVRDDDGFVRLLSSGKGGRRLGQFMWDGTPYFAVICKETQAPVTILKEGYRWYGRKGRTLLKARGS